MCCRPSVSDILIIASEWNFTELYVDIMCRKEWEEKNGSRSFILNKQIKLESPQYSAETYMDNKAGFEGHLMVHIVSSQDEEVLGFPCMQGNLAIEYNVFWIKHDSTEFYQVNFSPLN